MTNFSYWGQSPCGVYWRAMEVTFLFSSKSSSRRVAMEQFTFFLAITLRFSPKMAHSDYNKERLTGKPFDDCFQNASKKRGKKISFSKISCLELISEKIIMSQNLIVIKFQGKCLLYNYIV